MRSFNQKEDKTLVFLQYSRNLLGQSDDPLTISVSRTDDDSQEHDFSSRFQHYARMLLFYVLNEFDKAEGERHVVSSSMLHVAAPTCNCMFTIFVRALNFYVNARRYPHEKFHLREAETHSKFLRRMYDDGAPTTKHMIPFLSAEEFACVEKNKPPVETVLGLYDESVVAAEEGLFLVSKAMALERAGEYLAVNGDHKRSKQYLQRALDAYSDYGATIKVQRLQKQYSFIVAYAHKTPTALLERLVEPYMVDDIC